MNDREDSEVSSSPPVDEDELAARLSSTSDAAWAALMTAGHDLVGRVNPSALFAAHFSVTGLFPRGTTSESQHGTVVARGDWLADLIKRSPKHGGKTPSPDDVKLAADLSLEAVHIVSSPYNLYSAIQADSSSERRILARFLARMHIVRGSAYPEQTQEELREIFGPFAEHLERKTGAHLETLLALIWSIVRCSEQKLSREVGEIDAASAMDDVREARRRARSNSASETDKAVVRFFPRLADAANFACFAHMATNAERAAFVGCDEVLDSQSENDLRSWRALLDLVGQSLTTPAQQPALRELFRFLPTPAVVDSQERILIHDISSAFDRLMQALHDLLNDDPSLRDAYGSHRAAWVEQRTYRLLRNVFGFAHTFQSLSYPDPDRPGGTAEVDLLARWANWVLLVEVKAKKELRHAALTGIPSLRSVMKKNIVEAYRQADRARRFIESRQLATFEELGKRRRRVSIQRDKIAGVVLVSVSLHHLEGMAEMLRDLNQWNDFHHGEYPWSVSLADFQLVSEHIGGPERLVHYARRRWELLRSSSTVLGDEGELLGAYLATRLHPSIFSEQRYSGIWLTGYGEQFDSWMEFQRGDRDNATRPHLAVPAWISACLVDLRERKGDSDAQRICLTILDLAPSLLETLGTEVEAALAAPRSPDSSSNKRFELHSDDEDIAIVVLIGDELDRREWEAALAARLLMHKYRVRASRALGFGILRWDRRPVSTVTLVEEPWKPDGEIERALALEPPVRVQSGTSLPGRNAPCICGSGKKFKKCCLPRFRS